MTKISQFDGPVRIVRVAASPHDRVANLHDAAARWRAPDSGTAPAFTGNVVALRRPARETGGLGAPEPSIDAPRRLASAGRRGRILRRWMLLLTLSVAGHIALTLPLRNHQPPLASIGHEAISIEIVLGADQPAGLTPDGGTADVSAPAAAQAPEPVEAEVPTEAPPVEAATVTAAETPTAVPTTTETMAAAEPAPAVTDAPPPITAVAEPPPEATQAATASPPPTSSEVESATAVETPPDATPSESSVEVLASTVAAQTPSVRVVTPVTPTATPETPAAAAPVQAEPLTHAGAELQVAENPLPAEATAAAPATSDTAAVVPPTVTADRAPEAARPVTPVETANPDRQEIIEVVAAELLPQTVDAPRPVRRTAAAPPRRAPTQQRRTIRPAPQRAVAQGPRNDSQTRTPASRAAGGVGRGRSDTTSNYRGVVAAHLMRHRRFPADARSRGAQGSATVVFAISGSGSVTSVRLVRGSGVGSLDQEATAMVRRASPFPAPPNGRGMSFTVPVSFRLN